MWYTIQTGDSLSLLAQRYLGSLMLYMDIFDANRDVLVDPNIVQAGQRIWIPVDGKAKPDLLAQTQAPSIPQTSSPSPYEMGPPSPYQSTFPSSGSQTVLPDQPSAVLPPSQTAIQDGFLRGLDTQKLMLYGGIGLGVLGALALALR